ncbi:hypothetical protein [Actinoplanes aureus]|uniref:Uncharacterized protein n=1 Tax=Actinoplanes aureus TaxID=2792083 RepID=A0A931CEL9_9ACTN|nr:hypothetical protein [Actinoplanes aureus]MBG0566077.1 hypothetical protein [Actinoplanes aureus]
MGVLLTAGPHRHADLSQVDLLLLAGNAVLVVVVLALVLRRPRVRDRADGRWRLPAAERRRSAETEPEHSDRPEYSDR